MLDRYDLRQWVPVSGARLIYEARRGIAGGLAAVELKTGYGAPRPLRLLDLGRGVRAPR